MIKRILENKLVQKADYKKAIIVLGPRQVGKTTLIREVATRLSGDYLYVNGDDPAVRLLWDNPAQDFILRYTKGKKVIVIDEAQRLENIGLSIKMIVDAKMDMQVLVSGSSALEIANNINEPLTGRKWEYMLLPLSWGEIVQHYGFAEALQRLDNFLITGMYPEVVTNAGNEKELLTNIAGSYLYKDILEKGDIRKPELLLKLLQALAWQVGSEVSFNELAQLTGADKNTVASYIDLLEKAFVIFRLPPLARNLRNEIATSRKIYFYDNGVRNMLINNFAPPVQRNDIGALWENFIICERKKQIAYSDLYYNTYFWRNTYQAEIDYVEEADGVINAYEIKWNPKAKTRFPKPFTDAYLPASAQVIHRDNFWNFLDK